MNSKNSKPFVSARSGSDEGMSAFSALIDAQLEGFRGGFDPGERVEAVVQDIGDTYLTLDVHAKREGWIDRASFTDEDGQLTVAPGDRIEVWFAGMQQGAFLFTRRLSGVSQVQRSLRDAYAHDMPVEGVVKAEVSGGFQVDVGAVRGFCPYSQIDRVRIEDKSVYLGQRLPFRVVELGDDGRNVVLSRRALLESERDAQAETLRRELSVGDMRDGQVTRIADFGVFVDLGGIEGLVPMSELSWRRKVDPSDLVHPGETVRVAVREIDWDRGRISLSLREAQGDPWQQTATRFPVGSFVQGRVVALERFGAFVALETGIEGLVPMSFLGGNRRLHHAREALTEGQELTLRVMSLDVTARRMTLQPVEADAEMPSDGTPDGAAATVFGPSRPMGSTLGGFGDLLGEVK